MQVKNTLQTAKTILQELDEKWDEKFGLPIKHNIMSRRTSAWSKDGAQVFDWLLHDAWNKKQK